MKRKYTFNKTTVNKYCSNGIWDSGKSDNIETEIYSFLYDPEFEKHLEILIREVPQIESNIGDLFRIMEYYMEPEQDANQESFLAITLHAELKRLHFLQKIIESPDNKFEKVEIIVNQKPTSPLNSDFIISEIELNRLLIEGLLRDFKTYFNTNFQRLFFSYFNRELNLESITTTELLKITKQLESSEFNYKSYRINLEKEMIQVVLDYLNNETGLNPRNLKMTKPLATVIYYILSIFKVITKPQKESDITAYIRDMHKNPKLSI